MKDSYSFLLAAGMGLPASVFRPKCYVLLGYFLILGICCLGCMKGNEDEATLLSYGYRCLCGVEDAFDPFLLADENKGFQVTKKLLLFLFLQFPYIS
jgi:hypothetical protein